MKQEASHQLDEQNASEKLFVAISQSISHNNLVLRDTLWNAIQAGGGLGKSELNDNRVLITGTRHMTYRVEQL